jgi:hypothetical protein
MYDATTVFADLDAILDECLTEMSASYAQSVDHSGEPDTHLFILTGRTEDTELITELSAFLNKYDSAGIDIDHTAKGTYIAFKFDDEDISDAPPDREDSFRTVTPSDPTSQTVSECSNCRSSTPQAYPPLVLRYESRGYEEPEEETHSLCVKCSPGHFDDVVRAVEAFGVKDGEVTGVLFPEQEVYDEETHAKETIDPEWIPCDEIDNPYIEDVIPLIERDLI